MICLDNKRNECYDQRMDQYNNCQYDVFLANVVFPKYGVEYQFFADYKKETASIKRDTMIKCLVLNHKGLT